MLEKTKARIKTFGILRFAVCTLLIIAILLTLVFIFSNSAKTQKQSAAQSESFKEVVEKIIPKETDLGQKILKNIRKIAHFTEYGLLGIESSLLIFVLMNGRGKRYKNAAFSPVFALIVAFIDETVQIYSKRGPAVADMWIDVGGFFTYSLLTYIGIELLCLIKALTVKPKKTPRGEK